MRVICFFLLGKVSNETKPVCLLDGGFKYFLFSPLPGETIQFD